MTTTLPESRTGTEARSSWRDERRKDQLNLAETRELHADAALQRQFLAAEKAQELKGKARESKRLRKLQARQDRSRQLAKAGDWCKDRYAHLIMIPVIGVPGALAADGQAQWGIQQYGPAGIILPAFSEGAMWVFAAKTTQARKDNPDAPVWHLRAGTVVFAAIGGAMNFAHGMAQGGIWEGVTMALTSVSGVTAHQITTAGPRRSRQQRRDARLSRKQARLEGRVMRAAINDGTVVIASDGRSRVTVRPGAVALKRTWRGSTRLESVRDVQAEIDDITEAAIVLVDHARDERDAAQAEIEQARATAETALADRDRAVAAVLAEKDAVLADLEKARELAEGLREASAAADASASQAEARIAELTAASQARIDSARREAAGKLTAAEQARADAEASRNQFEAGLDAMRRERDQAWRAVEQARAERDGALEQARKLRRDLTDAKNREPRAGETKKDTLIRLYRGHEHHGNRMLASRTATELAEQIDLTPGTARTYVNQYLDDLDNQYQRDIDGEKGVA